MRSQTGCVGAGYRSIDSGYSKKQLKHFANLRDETKIPLLDWLGDFRNLLNKNGINDDVIWQAIKEHYKEYDHMSDNEADYLHWFTDTKTLPEGMKPNGMFEQISGMHYISVEIYQGCYKAYDISKNRHIDYRVPKSYQWDKLLKTLIEMKYNFIDFDSDQWGSIWWFDTSGADITETFGGYRKKDRNSPSVDIQLWPLLLGDMDNILKSSPEEEIKEFWQTEHKDKTDKELKEVTKNYCEPQTPDQFRAEYKKSCNVIKEKYKAPHLLKFLKKVQENKDCPILPRSKKAKPQVNNLDLKKSDLIKLCTVGDAKLSPTLNARFLGVSYISEEDRKTLKKILSKAYFKGGA